VDKVLVVITAISGSGSQASVSVGQTASAYADISANATLNAGMGATGKYQNCTLVSPGSYVPASTPVIFKVNTAATFTTCTADVVLYGWYQTK
jgi:hypothetical protein